jgi:hypothetical protein
MMIIIIIIISDVHSVRLTNSLQAKLFQLYNIHSKVEGCFLLQSSLQHKTSQLY